MKPLFEKHHFSYEMAMAVVFPELVRYSVLRDKMEVSVLKALYINLGHDYANFSVGLFQMKPSFAEVIRSMPRDLKGRNTGVKLADSSEFRNIKDFRREIVNDLEDPRKEAGYLIAFLRVCDRRFNISRDTITAIRFLATAYNTGFTKESAEIDKVSDLKFFNTKLFGGTMYSYADVSLFWYKTCSSALKN